MTTFKVGVKQDLSTFSLPAETTTQTTGIVGKRGTGKTTTSSVMVEGMLDIGAQVVVVDPLDAWWGLRAGADGRANDGYPILVLGGSHSDLPLQGSSGVVIADFIVEHNISAVLSLRHLSKREMLRFVADFTERLYERKGEDRYRTPLHLVVDEADAFAPQNVSSSKGADVPRAFGAIDDIVRRGRNVGLGVTLITQRTQAINKDVLSQVEILITHRLVGPQDRKALESWIEAHDANNQKGQFMASLASLPVGTAWFWSPGWLEFFELVKVRRRKTFDSSATPKFGAQPVKPAALVKVDLDAIREQLSATIEQAKANDPRELKRQIADLEKRLAARPTETRTETVTERVEIPMVSDVQVNNLLEVVQTLKAVASHVERAADKIASDLSKVRASPEKQREFKAAIRDKLVTVDDARQIEKRPAPTTTMAVAERTAVSAPQQRMLDALASFEALGVREMAKGNLATFSDQSSTSSGYRANLSKLHTSGLIHYPSGGMVALTEAGRALAEDQQTIRSLADLHAAWMARVSRPRARMLEVLIGLYPHGCPRDQLAHETDQSPTSSGYRANLSGLRGLGLIDYEQGAVVATDLLFPDGLR